jgi:hypothetical protein
VIFPLSLTKQKAFPYTNYKCHNVQVNQMKRNFISLVLLLFVNQSGIAQKQVNTFEQTWIGYLNQLRVSKNWGIATDFHIRTKDKFYRDLSVGVFRTGLTYYFTDNTTATAGYAYFHYFPDDGHSNVAQPEHRFWEQIQWNNNYPGIRLQHRIRLEERFRRKIKNDDALANGYNFNYRARYNLTFFTSLSKRAFAPKTLSFFIGDEVMLNFGKQIVYNTFDQNRVLAGFNYHINSHNNFQFGYMNVFQQLSSGKNYKVFHVARIYYLHTLDLRRKKVNE